VITDNAKENFQDCNTVGLLDMVGKNFLTLMNAYQVKTKTV